MGISLPSREQGHSLDGESWTEIDRRTDIQDFKDVNMGSFDVSAPDEFRFRRVTQMGKTPGGYESLMWRGVEFFGTLFK
jgi:hypothetical protein